MTTSQAFKEHVEHLVEMAEDGCDLSAKSLAALSLLAEGWRYGDPDPSDPPDGGGEVVDFQQYLKRLAA